MAKLVSKTYGEALYELAIEDNNTHEIKEEVLLLKEILANEHEVIEFLNNPKCSKEEKISFLEVCFSNRLSQTLLGFLVIIVTKGRQDDIASILDFFLEKMKEHDSIGVVSVTSAVELTKEQVKSINDKLLCLTKYQSLEINVTVDQSLIGGLVIRIGDRIVDNSIKSKLNSLQKSMRSVTVA